MSGMTLMLLSLAGLLAFIVGLATQRANLCIVLAGHDLIERREIGRFLGFFLCSCIGLIVLSAAHLAGLFNIDQLVAYKLSGVSLLGAALFGAGAVINGGCAFGSMAQLGRGNLRMIAVLPAMYVGAFLAYDLAPHARPMGDGTSLMMRSGLSVALILFAAVALTALISQAIRSQFRPRAPSRWSPALALIVIGALNAVLVPLVPSWSYAAMLADAATGDVSRVPQRALLLGLFLAGACIASLRDGTFRLQPIEWRTLMRTLVGGAAMGAGALTVPGGNDTLVLQGLPMLSPHAMPAYIVMCVTVFVLLAAARLWEQRRKTVLG